MDYLPDTAVLIAKYVAACRLRGLAPKSISNYGWALKHLSGTLPASSDGLTGLLSQTMSPESKRTLMVNVCTFLKWVSRNYEGYVAPTPEPLPGRKMLPRVFSRVELATILMACNGQRDRALILLPLDNGLRVGEIASLRRTDIANGHVRVQGKAGTRQVPISSHAERLLGGLGDGRHIWMGRFGPMGKHGVQMAYRGIFRRSGLAGRKLGPHTLRHTFGTEYIRGGGNVRVLQHIMGHSKLETTMIYVHLAGHDVKLDHSEHSPLRSLQLG